jgi:hypothetical protein
MGMVAGALLCYAATNYHLVRTADGFHVVHKVQAHLADAYVDVRSFGVDDWANHPELATAIVKEEKQQLMQGAAETAIQEGVKQALPDWPQP